MCEASRGEGGGSKGPRAVSYSSRWRRSLSLVALASLLLLFGVFALVLLDSAGSVASGWFLSALLAAGVVLSGFAIWGAARIDVARRRARRVGWRMCPVCLYDLSGDGGSPAADSTLIVCPECGGRYEMDGLRAAWTAPRR
jgi:hypothetical protein